MLKQDLCSFRSMTRPLIVLIQCKYLACNCLCDGWLLKDYLTNFRSCAVKELDSCHETVHFVNLIPYLPQRTWNLHDHIFSCPLLFLCLSNELKPNNNVGVQVYIFSWKVTPLPQCLKCHPNWNCCTNTKCISLFECIILALEIRQSQEGTGRDTHFYIGGVWFNYREMLFSLRLTSRYNSW